MSSCLPRGTLSKPGSRYIPKLIKFEASCGALSVACSTLNAACSALNAACSALNVACSASIAICTAINVFYHDAISSFTCRIIPGRGAIVSSVVQSTFELAAIAVRSEPTRVFIKEIASVGKEPVVFLKTKSVNQADIYFSDDLTQNSCWQPG